MTQQPALAHDQQHSDSKKILMKVFWILLVITIVEIIWGMFISHALPKWLNAIFFLSFTLIKAAYIVAEFMHLKYENKFFRASVLIPLFVFAWFIIAFCMDGNSYLKGRDKYHYNQHEKAPVNTHDKAQHH